MLEALLETLASFIVNFISSSGYGGIFILMTIESALIPLPSEITMPFAGSLVALGKLNLWLVSLAGALGNLFGSLLAYILGRWGQETIIRKLIRNYGRYFLISEKEFNHAENWFRKYGEKIVFTSRLLPAIRTYISLPAGIASMNLKKFIIYTTIGSFIWSLFLTSIGMIMGQNWKMLEGYFRKFDILIVVLGGGVVLLYFFKKNSRQKV